MVLANDKQEQELQQLETNNKINLTYTKRKKHETRICICNFAYSTHQDQQTGIL